MNALFFGISIYALGITGITQGSTVGFKATVLPCVNSIYEIACVSPKDRIVNQQNEPKTAAKD